MNANPTRIKPVAVSKTVFHLGKCISLLTVLAKHSECCKPSKTNDDEQTHLSYSDDLDVGYAAYVEHGGLVYEAAFDRCLNNGFSY